MPSTRERLQSTLAGLQAELSDLEELDPVTRDRLQATLNDIGAALAGQTGRASLDDEEGSTIDQNESQQSLAERLNDVTRGLESTHPELSTTLGGVINALAQMGI
jgi:hypothetical protein